MHNPDQHIFYFQIQPFFYIKTVRIRNTGKGLFTSENILSINMNTVNCRMWMYVHFPACCRFFLFTAAPAQKLEYRYLKTLNYIYTLQYPQ